jgi:2-dehydro-3-deoxygalactonokinase
MGGASFVAGDWGTSNLRLFLCDERGNTLDRADGPGAAQVKVPFAELFESLLEPWETRYGALPAVLCGMVGSSIGWTQAPYVPCPAVLTKIIDGCISVRAGRVHVVPGLRCDNRLRAPDFMRGEETQLLGALALDATLRHGRRLLCLPGTHTKWVVLQDGVINEFLSAPTGEVFGVLREHSVLVQGDSRTGDVSGDAAFEEGLKRFNDFPQAHLLHRLFECRGRQLDGELAARSAPAFLSGLLIASDVGGALHLFADSIAERTVCVIGAPRLTELYAIALRHRACGARQLDGASAVLAGLTRVHRQISSQVAMNES